MKSNWPPYEVVSNALKNVNNESLQSVKIKSYADIIKCREKNKSELKSKAANKNSCNTYLKSFKDKNMAVASSRGRNNKSSINKPSNSLNNWYSERKNNI